MASYLRENLTFDRARLVLESAQEGKASSRKYKSSSFRGYYKSNYLRSYIEFLFALYLDKVKGENFRSEGTQLTSKTTNKKKIPDFVVYDNFGNIKEIIEIKPNAEETEQTIVDYVANNYVKTKDYKVSFVKIDRKVKKYLRSQIVEAMGLDAFLLEEQKYKSQSNLIKAVGFPGEKNPMFGKQHSAETRAKISAATKGKNVGKNNPMFGKTHSEEARKKIAANWLTADKHAIVAKGMITHIKKFSNEQLTVFVEYANAVLLGKYTKRPEFLNRAYTVSTNKINTLFGSAEGFWAKVYE